MKAVVIHAAKDLRIEERQAGEPGPSQVAIAIKAGGICGSDLHYYQDGGFGAVRVRQPMILGHEVAGLITSVGAGVAKLSAGDRVAISPSLPCKKCEYCLRGLENHCLDMRFYGSAMRVPHVDGAFAQAIIAEASQCHKLAEDTSFAEAAFAEPFAVALHAVNRAGSLLGKRVLITGCGPIGALCIVAARAHGAREIVVTDVVDAPLAYARAVGADRTINVSTNGADLEVYGAEKGSFDVMFEASGNARAINAGIAVLRPRGVLVQVGLGGDAPIALNTIVSKEIELRGSFRFQDEFGLALDLINQRRVDVKPLLSATYPLADAVAAFEAAGDRRTAMKVQLAFE